MSNGYCLLWCQQKRMRQRARKAAMSRFNSRASCRNALPLVPENASVITFKKRIHAGFTLIEVLIALMIIAIALAAAVRATTESIRATRHVRNVTIAHFIAMNVISEIQTNMLPVSESNPARGETNMLGQDWTWSATIQSKNQFKLEKIEVKVRLKDRVITTVTGYHA